MGAEVSGEIHRFQGVSAFQNLHVDDAVLSTPVTSLLLGFYGHPDVYLYTEDHPHPEDKEPVYAIKLLFETLH